MDNRVNKLEKSLTETRYILIIMTFVSILNIGAALSFFQAWPKPDWDYIAITLTIFEIFLAIAAVAGFWTLRGITKERAEEVAEDVAMTESRKIATEEAKKAAIEQLQNTIPPLVARSVRTAMEAFKNEDKLSEDQVSAIMAALNDEDNGNGK